MPNDAAVTVVRVVGWADEGSPTRFRRAKLGFARLSPTYKESFLKTIIPSRKAAARATAMKDRRVNIRLSSADLSDIQVKALEEGIPYQTLIASVLHKYVTGRLAERPTPEGQQQPATMQRADEPNV
jgi:hypothetical protein